MDLPTPANQSEQIVDSELDVSEITSSPLQNLPDDSPTPPEPKNKRRRTLFMAQRNQPTHQSLSKSIGKYIYMYCHFKPLLFHSNPYPTASLITS